MPAVVQAAIKRTLKSVAAAGKCPGAITPALKRAAQDSRRNIAL